MITLTHVPIDETTLTGYGKEINICINENSQEAHLCRHVRLEDALVPAKRQAINNAANLRTEQRLLRLWRPYTIFQRNESVVPGNSDVDWDQTEYVDHPFSALESGYSIPTRPTGERFYNRREFTPTDFCLRKDIPDWLLRSSLKLLDHIFIVGLEFVVVSGGREYKASLPSDTVGCDSLSLDCRYNRETSPNLGVAVHQNIVYCLSVCFTPVSRILLSELELRDLFGDAHR